MLVYRITPRKDLKEEINLFTQKNNIKAGIIIFAVGSLSKAVLRMSDETIKQYEGLLEILSIQGTVSLDGIHAHLSFSDEKGVVSGGHLKNGCKVHTTVELAILKYEGTFKRKFDFNTGFKELYVD